MLGRRRPRRARQRDTDSELCDAGSGLQPKRATAISVGDGSACALLTGGTVECWGDNESGQLGTGTLIVNSTTPVQVANLSDATAISVGDDSSACALLSSGTVNCWGNNSDGQLGNGTTTNSSLPVPVVW